MINNDNPIIMENERQNYTLVTRRPVAEITVVPNPAKDWAAFNYTLPENATSGVIVISDASGREVASMPVSGKQDQQVWDIRDMKKGVYLYTLKAGTMSKNGKLIIN